MTLPRNLQEMALRFVDRTGGAFFGQEQGCNGSGNQKAVESRGLKHFGAKGNTKYTYYQPRLDHMGPAKHSTSGRLPWPAGISQAVRVLNGLWWLVDYQRT